VIKVVSQDAMACAKARSYGLPEGIFYKCLKIFRFLEELMKGHRKVFSGPAIKENPEGYPSASGAEGFENRGQSCKTSIIYLETDIRLSRSLSRCPGRVIQRVETSGLGREAGFPTD
jgi:hypothetical protein